MNKQEKPQESNNTKKIKWIIGGGIIAAFASTLCCIVPLILFMLGLSGAWVSNLTAMEPYKPYFLSISIIMVSIGFWKVYYKPKVSKCGESSFCDISESNLINKIILWATVVVLIMLLIYPYVAPAILERF